MTKSLRILVMADIDEFPDRLGNDPVDLVIGCGDLPQHVLTHAAYQCECKNIMAVNGNHDPERDFTAPVESLHLKIRELGGLTFGGFNGTWQYKPGGFHLYSQEQAAELLHAFPRVDVMVTHNSPSGVHERGDPAHTGFIGLRQYILRTRPRFLFHGHQHVDADSLVGDTRVIGVCGFRIVDLELPPQQEK